MTDTLVKTGALVKSKAPEIVTFGCRLNVFEGEVMRGAVKEAGLEGAVIFNTCAVTAEATRQARQAIRRMARENPDAQIIVTGCAAQIAPQTFADMPEVARVIGNQEKLKAETYARALPERRNEAGALVEVDDIMARAALMPPWWKALKGAPGPRSGSKWLRPSLHLLHHPLWPGAKRQRAARRCRRSGAPACSERFQGGRPDRD